MNPKSKTLREIEQSGLVRPIDIGAYVKLLLHYSRHGSLPIHQDQLQAIAGVEDAPTWSTVRAHVAPLFYREGESVHPKVMRTKTDESELACSRKTMERVIGKWCEILPELPEPMVISDDRYRSFVERWREAARIKTSELPEGYSNEEDGLRWWSGLFRHMRKSDFLMGRKTDFRAHFDFVLQRSSFRKLLEGVYHAKR